VLHGVTIPEREGTIGLVHVAACTRQGQTFYCKHWTSLLSAVKTGGMGLHTSGKDQDSKLKATRQKQDSNLINLQDQ